MKELAEAGIRCAQESQKKQNRPRTFIHINRILVYYNSALIFVVLAIVPFGFL